MTESTVCVGNRFFHHFASLCRTPVLFAIFKMYRVLEYTVSDYFVTLLFLAMHANVWMLVHFNVFASHKTLSCERSVEKSNDYLLPS